MTYTNSSTPTVEEQTKVVLQDKCIFYKFADDNCSSTYEECGRKQVDCPLSRGDHCWSLWEVKDNITTVVSAGCSKTHEASKDECSNECIGKKRGEKYYCCCKEPLCNSKLKLPPPPEPSSLEKPEPEPYPKTQSAFIILWSVIPIIIIATLVVTYIYKYKRHKSQDDRHPRNIRADPNHRELNNYRNNHELSVLTPFRRSSNDSTDGAGADGFFMTGGTNLNNNHNRRINSPVTNHYHDANQTNSSMLTTNQHNDKRIDLSQLKLLEIIGSGRFGTVHKATAPISLDNDDDISEKTIAVKIISRKDYQSWQNERDMYNSPKIKHPNILNLFYSDEHLETESCWLIVEYASKGSLYKFLSENVINYKELLNISLGIVQGLAHLHESNIVHRDFKSKNVLLRHNLTPCITDFGVAKILDSSYGSQDERRMYFQVGTPRYMAPEVLECSVLFTKASFTKIDVYALSLVLWELVSRCRLITKNTNTKTESLPRTEVSYSGDSQQLQQQDNKSPTPPCSRPSASLEAATSDGGRESSNQDFETASESVVIEMNGYLEDGTPPPYKTPFEEVAGHNPDINTMYQIVVVQKLRPTIREQWRVLHPINDICHAIQDGWEYDHDARISASCFVERVETLAQTR